MSDSIPIHGIDHIPTYLPDQRNSHRREEHKSTKESDEPHPDSIQGKDGDDKKIGRCKEGIGGHVDLEA